MKIYIVGPVSSRISTLSKLLSTKLSIPYTSLDEVVHIPDKEHPWGNRKRDVSERDDLFHSIISKKEWIIEDVGRPYFEDGMRNADIIILLDILPYVRKIRILKRWISQRIGIEKSIYKPDIKMLKGMYRWSNDYDTGKDSLKERMFIYQEKVIVLKNDKDICNYLN
jgi:adenylate kinase family enzyme